MIMKKEVATLKLREAQENLRQAEIILEMHENSVRELREDIENLEAIINKKDDWRDEVAYLTLEQNQLIRNKIQLMQEMHAFAHVKNEGWTADWKDGSENKYGISYTTYGGFGVGSSMVCNDFVFGVSVKSEEIAQEMLEEFGERIKEIYNKQY